MWIKISGFRLPAATVVFAGGLCLMGCGEKGGSQEAGPGKRMPTVSVAAVRTEPISRLLQLTGEAVAVESIVIAAMVDGPISYCPWREGDRIEQAGQKLIEISREVYEVEVKAAEAALGVAQAKLNDLRAGTRPEEIAKAREAVRQLEESTAFGRSDLDRITQLVESGSIPAEALDRSRVDYVGEQAKLGAAQRQLEMLEAGYTQTAIAVQEAVVKEASAKLDLARARFSECSILAPFAGTITRVHVRPGDMAAIKAPLLELADLSSLVIRSAVPEAHASAVREGMTGSVSLDSLLDQTFSAKVVRVYPELDRRMRTRTIELALDEAATLAPGMFARIQLVLESTADAVTIPQQAVGLSPRGVRIAHVVIDGKAVIRNIETGIEASGRVQVLEGLQPGEQVVTAGQERLRDGMQVHVDRPATGPTGGGSPASTPGAGRSGRP